MKRLVGTKSIGIRMPIIKEGDQLTDIVPNVLAEAVDNGEICFKDKDVVAITESLLARSQGNYCHTKEISKDLNGKFHDHIGVVFPITSRNRFSIIMRAICETGKKIHVFLNYPQDEVGNALFDKKILIDHKIDVNNFSMNEKQYRELVGHNTVHHFTGVDYVDLYKSFAVNDNVEIHLTNDPHYIVKVCDELLICNIHEREYYKMLFKELGAKTVYAMDDIMTASVDGSGYNPDYGLYGSNLAGDDQIKLFPRDAQAFAEKMQSILVDRFGVQLEVMVYGDGAFKDPVGKIWELADPVVSPGFTSGLNGTPNEVKIKYLADTEFNDLRDEDLSEAMIKKIENKNANLYAHKESLGTTPRQLTDLLGSLADLTSGSGDKGTPVVLIQGYFDNYASK